MAVMQNMSIKALHAYVWNVIKCYVIYYSVEKIYGGSKPLSSYVIRS